MLPMKLIGIIKFFNYRIGKILGRAREGIWIGHCATILGSWHHIKILGRRENKETINRKRRITITLNES